MEKPLMAAILEEAELIRSVEYDQGQPRLRMTTLGKRILGRMGRASSRHAVGLGWLRTTSPGKASGD